MDTNVFRNEHLNEIELLTREHYLEWIKKETKNSTLTGEEAGVKMALNILLETDPLELMGRDVKSESIDSISITYETNPDGIPLKVFRWLRPYYRLGSVL